MIELADNATRFKLSPTLAANELVIRRRNAGKDVLHMGFGESPFPVPARLQKSLCASAHHKEYLPTAGLESLKKEVARYYKEKSGLDTDKYDVLIAPGSKLILYALQMAIRGDLLMPVPSWVSYAPQAHMLKTNVIKFDTQLSEKGYYISPDVLQKAIDNARENGLNPRKIVLNYPNNPTGLTFAEENLREIAEICIRENILIISDEIYGLISFDDNYRTIAKYAPTHTAISSGLSKHLSLGGWRLGIGFIPKAIDGLHDLLCNIASETWSAVPAPIQYAVIEAYQGHEDIEDHVRACTDIHKYVTRYVATKLRALDVDAPEPQGAFYNYPNFRAFREALSEKEVRTSENLARFLTKHYGLVSLPASAFGADDEVLALRLSSCDYDGDKALKAYQNGAPLDEEFVSRFAPRVKKAMQAFEVFTHDIQGRNAPSQEIQARIDA